jgi:hypothetical protein
MPGKSLNGKAYYELRLFLRKAFNINRVKSTKAAGENGVWVVWIDLSAPANTLSLCRASPPEGENKRNDCVYDQKNTPPEQGILFYSIEVTMSLLFTHSTRTILEGVNPASASQFPESVSFGTTFIRLSYLPR